MPGGHYDETRHQRPLGIMEKDKEAKASASTLRTNTAAPSVTPTSPCEHGFKPLGPGRPHESWLELQAPGSSLDSSIHCGHLGPSSNGWIIFFTLAYPPPLNSAFLNQSID